MNLFSVTEGTLTRRDGLRACLLSGGNSQRMGSDKGQLLHAIDLDGESYMRSERSGMLIGVYEQDAQPWAADGTPWEYGENELLQPELDRITPELQRACVHPQPPPAQLCAAVRCPCPTPPSGKGTGVFWVHIRIALTNAAPAASCPQVLEVPTAQVSTHLQLAADIGDVMLSWVLVLRW